MPNYTDKSLICLARFSANPKRKHIDFQRKLFLEKCASNPHILTGPIAFEIYKKELKIAAATLSPFGFGEICFRDFEAILAGSVLLKPDMSHIQTWPNVYLPHETYIPLKWDGSNILSLTENVLGNPKDSKAIAENAFKVLNESYLEIDKRVKEFVEQIIY